LHRNKDGDEQMDRLTLTTRQHRIAVSFIVGAMTSQLVALPFLFPPRAGWAGWLWRTASDPRGTVAAWSLAAAVTAGYVIYSATRSSVIRSFALRPAAWGPLLAIRLVAIPMSFVTGFFEVVFFRKVVMDVAQHHAYSPSMQVIISAGVFGVAHALWVVFSGKVRAAVAVIIATGTFGGLLAIVYLLGGRSVAPCVAAHIVVNLILEPWLVLTSVTGNWARRQASSTN
jgi:hypothetical protein